MCAHLSSEKQRSQIHSTHNRHGLRGGRPKTKGLHASQLEEEMSDAHNWYLNGAHEAERINGRQEVRASELPTAYHVAKHHVF